MGQLFTNPGSALIDQKTQQPTFIGSPNQVLGQTQKMLQQRSQSLNPDFSDMPRIGQPSLQQAAQSGANPGGVNAFSPGLNKAGKLMTLLTSGLQGALAGRAASEQATVASGGRRSGGAGMGFEAAEAYPWAQAQRSQQLQQEQAKTGLMQAQTRMAGTSMPIPLPGGQQVFVPAGQLGQILRGLPAAQVGAESREKVEAGKEKTQEDITGKNIASKEKIAKMGQGAPIPVDESVANLAGIPELAGTSVGKASWDNINKALTAKGYKTQDLGQEGLWLIDRAGNRIKRIGESPGVGRMQALAQSRVVAAAANPEEPGNLTYMSAGQAQKTGALAPQSAPTAAAKKAATSAVPTNIGNQVVAFNTAMQHADLLQSALSALNNGDVKTLNSLKNRFKTEFGSPDVTNFQTISNAYSREITKMLSAGHMTDAEIAQAGGTIPANASPQQILGALQSYRQLAQSKLNMLNQQVKASKGGSKEIHYKVVNGALVPQGANP